MSGYAVVGAAFLELNRLSHFIHTIPEPGFTCKDLMEKGYVSMDVTTYRSDRFSKIRLMTHELVVRDEALPCEDQSTSCGVRPRP